MCFRSPSDVNLSVVNQLKLLTCHTYHPTGKSHNKESNTPGHGYVQTRVSGTRLDLGIHDNRANT